MAHKPFDRSFLDTFAAVAIRDAWTLDLGCGPGQIGAYVAAPRALRMLGVDLSLEMLHQRCALLPGNPSVEADMGALPFADRSVGAVVAFYSLIHIRPDDLGATLTEINRVLLPGGHLALTTHVTPPDDTRTDPGRKDVPSSHDGTVLHRDEMLSERVDLDFYFYSASLMAKELATAGFRIVSSEERDPYPGDVEAQTRRAYLLAMKSE